MLMFWLMLGASVIKGVGGIVGRAQERANAKAQIDQKLKELNLETAQGEASINNQIAADKSQAEQSVREQAFADYLTQTAEAGNLQAMQIEGEQAKGALAAQTVSGGIQQGTTMQEVLDDSIDQAIGQKRAQMSDALGGSLARVNEVRRTFQPGSSYMNLYQQKKDSLLQSAAMQTSYLEDQKASYDYWKGGWWATDLFAVAGEAASFAADGYSNKWWGQGAKATTKAASAAASVRKTFNTPVSAFATPKQTAPYSRYK